MTRLEIRTLTRKKLGETSSAFWTDDEIDTYINLGQSDIAQRTFCLRKTGYISTTEVVANSSAEIPSEWTLSTNFSKLVAVTGVFFHQNGRNWVGLNPMLKVDLDLEYNGWRDAVGRTLTEPITYNYECQPGVPNWYWWELEEDKIGIYPPCNADNATANNLMVDYAYDTTDMSSDSATPQIPRRLHLAITEFATATGFETRGLQDKANDAWEKYFARLKDYHINKLRGDEDADMMMKPHRSV